MQGQSPGLDCCQASGAAHKSSTHLLTAYGPTLPTFSELWPHCSDTPHS